MTTAFDAIIIGAGQAGPPLARRLAASGMSVAIIERGAFGGTCVNTGCIPTKTLIASAYAAHMARRAADFGVAVDGPVRVDMSQVKARKDAIFRTVATWRRTEPQNSRQMHGLPRPCALSRATRGRGRRDRSDRRADFHQCRGTSIGAETPGARSSRLSDEQLDDGGRFPAAASGDCRGQLCRARIRANVSPLWQ